MLHVNAFIVVGRGETQMTPIVRYTYSVDTYSSRALGICHITQIADQLKSIGCEKIPTFNQDHLCSASQLHVIDLFGHHTSVCPVTGDRIRSHNVLRDIMYDFCTSAARRLAKEVPDIFPSSSERPTDIFDPNFSLGKDFVLEAAVTCPLQYKEIIRKEFKRKVSSTSLLF